MLQEREGKEIDEIKILWPGKMIEPDRLKSIAENNLFAPDSRTIIIKIPGRTKSIKWNSDKVRKFSESEDRKAFVGTVAFQMFQAKVVLIRGFIPASS